MTASIAIDVILTSKLWLADELAWRVSVLNLPGSTAEALYSDGGLREFRAEGDRVFWMGRRDDPPRSATLRVTLPGDLRPQQQDPGAMVKGVQRRALVAAVLLAALTGAGITLAVSAISDRGRLATSDLVAPPAHECRQALARLQTLSVTPASAEDIKKAIQRELPTCLEPTERSR